MKDHTVPPELVGLHPLLARMVKLTGASVIGADAYDAWAHLGGNAVVVFTHDPDRFAEALDLAAVLPELQATVGGTLRIGLLPPAASRAIARRYGFARRPVLALLRDGQYLGAVEGLRDWTDDTADLWRRLAAAPAANTPSGSQPKS
jgi:hydrogenase-1 operon protein HyaE